MQTVSYSGRMQIQTGSDGSISNRDRLHTLLDDAIDAYEGDTVIVESAVIDFERPGGPAEGSADMPRVRVSLSSQGNTNELGSVIDGLSQTIATIGLEPDTESAASAINID